MVDIIYLVVLFREVGSLYLDYILKHFNLPESWFHLFRFFFNHNFLARWKFYLIFFSANHSCSIFLVYYLRSYLIFHFIIYLIYLYYRLV